jgi:trehalose/maltose hydrolase-like predicted phosphorylase
MDPRMRPLYGGVRVLERGLSVAPRLPRQWKRLEFSIQYRGLRLRFRIGRRRPSRPTTKVRPSR